MSWPEPKPGLVIRYSYLWLSEADAGREEGVKDRPCAIVVVVHDRGARKRVLALPITHSPPHDGNSLEMPPETKRRLGLDERPSWIVLTEWNDFLWPGPDLRPLAGKGPESVSLGMLPPRLFALVQSRFLLLARQRLARKVKRSE